MQREPGFYWVRVLADGVWEAALFEIHEGRALWFRAGVAEPWLGSDLSEIGARITAPNERLAFQCRIMSKTDAVGMWPKEKE